MLNNAQTDTNNVAKIINNDSNLLSLLEVTYPLHRRIKSDMHITPKVINKANLYDFFISFI